IDFGLARIGLAVSDEGGRIAFPRAALHEKDKGQQIKRVVALIAEEGVERIDLIKVDVQKAEWEVLRGIADGDWPKIQQVAAEVHDIDGRVAQIVSFLDARGFAVVSVQDPMYAATNIHNLYARRKEAR
ncbi:MAG: Holliday junction resolvase RuvX, partial [Myxococcales bacterium]|nr:Holliday junction resolvase RuvX [Myxococcales bacterium]